MNGHAMTDGAVDTAARSLISLRGVTKAYVGNGTPAVTAVDAVDLDVRHGEFVMVTGRSGSGKTTLLNLIAGLATPTAGTVALDGDDIWAMTDRERTRLRNQEIGFVFQFPSLMPALTVLENVALPLELWPASGSAAPTENRARELLSIMGLDDKVHAWPRQLSAGQQQRVVLARALARSPRILLADEPTSNLDERTEGEVMAAFRDVHRASSVTIVMVTHTSDLLSWGTRSVLLAQGRILEDVAIPGIGA
jgi:ABC-type lipoprotein export system ATPase subunit